MARCRCHIGRFRKLSHTIPMEPQRFLGDLARFRADVVLNHYFFHSDTWLNRKLSLKGKITLINNRMVSILHYPCACSFTPVRVLAEVKKVITQFLWDGKRPKVAYNLMIQPIDLGGLRLVDLETRIQASDISLIRLMMMSTQMTFNNLS